ncbi:MAG: hypothetical protein GC200_08040 [Tepidisphaera sp.]|nr:hypothetical protein [Tepidisphaera sp.]
MNEMSGGDSKARRPKPDTSADEPSGFAGVEAALAFLESRTNVEAMKPSSVDAGRVFTLDRMRALMSALDNPQASYKCVHVAGSKGKGSVCEMVASALEACGYTVGLYTSPHLIDLSERVRINQMRISGADLTSVLSRVARAEASLAKDLGQATYFELLTAAALQHFADQAVDLAVIEVGLGGLRDATNVITPEVSAITTIHREHTEILGNTLEEIASAKAGILKPGVPGVTVPQAPEVMKVLRETAARVGARLEALGEEIEFSSRVGGGGEQGPRARVVVTTPRSSFEHFVVPLKGEHQAINCGLALAVMDKLRERGVDTPEVKVAAGLERTPTHGRMEMVLDRPRIIVDGAHTPESVAGVVKTLGGLGRHDSTVAVFGCAADKDVPGMLRALAQGADKVIFTRAAQNVRSADPRDLQKKFAEISPKMSQIAGSVRDAINLAHQAINRDDLIVVTGSFAIAGEAKKLILERDKKPREIEPVIREIKPGAISPERRGKPKGRD